MPASQAADLDDRIQETQFSWQYEDAGQEEESGAASFFPNVRPVTAPQALAKAPRVLGPDLLRGLLMVLQSIDHAAINVGAWGHGQGTEGESDGQIVDTWIPPVAWTARTLTHLCAPGFMFLLGMGIVYFGRSRSKLGWSAGAMIKHFFVRGLVLAILSELLGLIIMRKGFIIVNIVLLALGVNYFITGLFWLALNASEKTLTRLLSSSRLLRSSDSADETRPLLASESTIPSHSPTTSTGTEVRAASISFHLHNTLLVLLSILAIWLNVWMSPTHGHCQPVSISLQPGGPSPSGRGAGFDFWFYPVWTPLVMSPFPPIAWLSFAILGLLYGRLVTSAPQKRSTTAIVTTTLLAGLALLLLFVGTRLLHAGNLSEGCLNMPEQGRAHGASGNQFLASFRSFFYVIKYPPSPAYLFYSMGLNLVLLAGFGALPEKVARRIPGLLVFGTSALFFYALHLPLYSALGVLTKMWFGFESDRPDNFSGGKVISVGDGAVFWSMWAIGLLILYPLCRWYGQFKTTRAPDSIFRFF